MLIPTSFNRLPSDEGCHNGQIVMGTTLGQISNGLAQISNVKALAEAHYQVSHSRYGINGFGSAIGGTTQVEVLNAYKSDREYNFLYQSTHLSHQLAIIIRYNAYDDNTSLTPDLKIRLRDTASNSYAGTLLDYGIRFQDGLHLQTNPDDLQSRQIFTGCQTIAAPSGSAYDFPRPLYVPSANRGELLNIQVLLTSVALISVHIYDIYQPEVTP